MNQAWIIIIKPLLLFRLFYFQLSGHPDGLLIVVTLECLLLRGTIVNRT